MFAIIRTGGKQYRAEPGQELLIEKLTGEAGGKISFAEVLLVADGGKVSIGTPLVDGAIVEAEIISQERGPKITMIKHKAKKGYRKKQGHRQDLTRVKILEVTTEEEKTPARRKQAVKAS